MILKHQTEAVHRIKNDLRKQFADRANALDSKLAEIAKEVGKLEVSLEDQMQSTQDLTARLQLLQPALEDIRHIEKLCEAANIEENDLTVLTTEDLDFQMSSISRTLEDKLAFLRSQASAREQSNITAAKREEWESMLLRINADNHSLQIRHFLSL